MIVTLTKKELEKIERGEAEIERQHKAAEEKARALRPDAPTPPYGDAKGEEIDKIYYEWMKTGSAEWRQAFNAERIIYFKLGSARNKVLQEADEKLLKRISKSQAATVRELKRQVGIYLQSNFLYNADGAPDYDSIRKELKDLFYKPMQTLDTDNQVEIENYIDIEAGKLPPRVEDHKAAYRLSCGITTPVKGTDSGERVTVKHTDGKKYEEPVPCDYTVFYFVPARSENETTEERHFSVAPKDYVTTVDRLSKKAFAGELVKPTGAKETALWGVKLSPAKSRQDVKVRAIINYDELIKSGVFEKPPQLNADDYDVHDAILSELNAGNFAFTKTMLYRVMTGKMQGYLPVPEEADATIEDALLKFKGNLKAKYKETDKDGNEIAIELDEPILTYIRGRGYLNGKYVDDLIIVPKDERFTPPLLKWARFNRNEIDTRDVTLLDVKGLNNGRESRVIKMCLYRRLINMKNDFERKYHSKKELPANQRSIRYDFIYEAIGLNGDTITKDKRHDVKSKIDKCMSFWKDKGVIADYQHKKDKAAGNAYNAVEVFFLEK